MSYILYGAEVIVTTLAWIVWAYATFTSPIWIATAAIARINGKCVETDRSWMEFMIPALIANVIALQVGGALKHVAADLHREPQRWASAVSGIGWFGLAIGALAIGLELATARLAEYERN